MTKKPTSALPVMLVALLGCGDIQDATHDATEFRGHDDDDNEQTYDGIIETGLNRFLGDALFDWTTGAETFGGNMLGEYDPDNAAPIPLDTDTPGSAVLSTFVDTDFQTAMGIPPAAIDYSGENFPLHGALVQVGPSVGARQSLPHAFDAEPYSLSRSYPSETITLDDWAAASGTLSIRCRNDGTAKLKARFENLIPNGVYTLWHVTVPPPDSPMPFGLLPAGGVPNVWVASRNGKGKFVRELDYCPNDDGTTLSYQVAYHADGSLYGAFPDAPENGLYGGTVTIEQMVFPIAVDLL